MQSSADLPRILLWTIAVFFSILIHELGHAAMGKRYGATPLIHLHGFGGLAIFPGAAFTRKQNILVSAAGPAASLALGGLTYLVTTEIFPPATPAGVRLKNYLIFINFFWTFINLLPILPLDGGQIIRDVLGPTRREITRWVGVICAGGMAFLAFKYNQVFLGLMLAYLGFINFQDQNNTFSGPGSR